MKKTLALGLVGILLITAAGCGMKTPSQSRNTTDPSLSDTTKDIPVSLKEDPSLVSVVKVISGDEFVAKVDGFEENVRLIGVAVNDSKDAQKKALEFAKKNLEGKEVRLEADKQDKDSKGKLFRYVYLSDGSFYNRMLLEEGLGRTTETKINTAHKEEFAQVAKASAKSSSSNSSSSSSSSSSSKNSTTTKDE